MKQSKKTINIARKIRKTLSRILPIIGNCLQAGLFFSVSTYSLPSQAEINGIKIGAYYSPWYVSHDEDYFRTNGTPTQITMEKVLKDNRYGTSMGSIVSGETQIVQPDNPAIRYVGRFTDDFRFGWSGCMVETDLTGTDISAIIDLVEGNEAAVTAVVNGKEMFFRVIPGRRTYPIATGLSSGKKHHIVLFKRSEGFTGTLQFGGFELSAGSFISAPAPRSRKILALGDSITCGYGNEALSVQEGNTIGNQNGYMSYAAIAARSLGADLMMICWSGRGIFRNLSPVNDHVLIVNSLRRVSGVFSKI